MTINVLTQPIEEVFPIPDEALIATLYAYRGEDRGLKLARLVVRFVDGEATRAESAQLFQQLGELKPRPRERLR